MSEPRLTEAEFEPLADRELSRLLEALIAVSDALDVDLASGVLTIQFTDDGKFVVNSHRAARQIWLAAMRNAWHFDWDRASERWLTSTGAELWATVREALQMKLGAPVALG